MLKMLKKIINVMISLMTFNKITTNCICKKNNNNQSHYTSHVRCTTGIEIKRNMVLPNIR